jgi:hypothetical protein
MQALGSYRGGDNVDAFLGGFRLWEEDFLPRNPLSKKNNRKGAAA